MTLCADKVPLNSNSQDNPAVISMVNNPKLETTYSPVIATIIHTITKQMGVRNSQPSFLLMEEKEIPKIRADVFFRLKQGEFITYADGKHKKVQFKLADIQRELPK